MLNWRGRSVAAALVAGVVGLAGVAAGQDEPRAEGAKAKVTTKQPEPPAAPEFTVTVEFPGGTVGQYIEALKKAAGGRAVNVVASRAAMEVQIGPVSLRDVSVYTALSAIRSAAGRETVWSVGQLVSPAGKLVEGYSLEFATQQQARSGIASDSSIQVFSLRDLVEPLPGDPAGVPLTKPPEVVLTAMKAALDMMGERGMPADMKFHEDSGLLIIHGNVEQISAVKQTLQQMGEDVRRRREAAKASVGPRVDRDDLRTELKKRQVLRGQAARDMDRSATALERLRKMAEGGQVSTVELADAEAKLDEARGRMEMSDIEMERLQTMMKAAEAGPASVGLSSVPPETRVDQLRGRIQELREMDSRKSQELEGLRKKGLGEDHKDVRRTSSDLAAIRADLTQTEAMLADLQVSLEKERAPQGRSVAVYDLPPMGAKAREQLISAIRGLEAATNNPEKLKIQSVQGDSKLVIEADGAMHAVVRGMVREVAGARGDREPAKSDEKPKGGR